MTKKAVSESKIRRESDESQDGTVKESPRPDALQAVSEALDADFFLFSGPLDRDSAFKLIDLVKKSKIRKNVALILTTQGGNPDAAYIIAKYLKRNYDQLILYVFGSCKSAGTLVAFAADLIVMSELGEFGPLDVQLVRRDEIFATNSGLDISEALESIGYHVFRMFEKQFLELIGRSGGAITTKTASEIAGDIAIGLLAPITAQINPMRIGEIQRAIQIALEYGERLDADPSALHRLVHHYPSHSFVIDFEEACALFDNIRLVTDGELQLEQGLLLAITQETGEDYLRKPHPTDAMVAAFKPQTESPNDNDKASVVPGHRDDNDTPKKRNRGD